MKRLVVFPTILKSMFYQANWNVENMQGTGFSWLVKDLFRRNGAPFPDDLKMKDPEYFNTNPYLIMFILGMLLRESKDYGRIGEYKKTYASALAALGDSFFWHSLRPFTFFLAVWMALTDPRLAVVIYLLVYNAFHFGFRFLGFYYGYDLGRNVILLFRRIGFNKWSRVFDSVTTFMAGAAVAAAVRYQSHEGYFPVFKALILFGVGTLVARKISASIGLMCAAGILGFMLMAGV